jgi:pimeloyl-ACP methyl ester carboxylesterase
VRRQPEPAEPAAVKPGGGHREPGRWNKRTARPVLVIGNTHDPSTPYANAKKMVAQLRRARLLTVNGYGHTVLLNPSRCASDHVANYVIRGVLPGPGPSASRTSCPSTPHHEVPLA